MRKQNHYISQIFSIILFVRLISQPFLSHLSDGYQMDAMEKTICDTRDLRSLREMELELMLFLTTQMASAFPTLIKTLLFVCDAGNSSIRESGYSSKTGDNSNNIIKNAGSGKVYMWMESMTIFLCMIGEPSLS